MKGTFYGVDLKLTPSAEGPKPVVIEINGVDSGTDFYRYPEGQSYYDAWARAMKEVAGDKVFVHSSLGDEECSLMRAASSFAHRDDLRKITRGALVFIELFADRKLPQPLWMRGQPDGLTRCDFDSENEAYSAAAQRVGLETVFAERLRIQKSALEVTTTQGTKETYSLSEIGAIHATSKKLATFPHAVRTLCLNDYVREEITEYKAFLTDIPVPSGVSIPPTAVHAPGIGSVAALRAFIQNQPHERFVVKPGRGLQGTGISILERDTLLALLTEQSDWFENTLEYQTIVEYAGVLMAPYLTTIVQPFIPSIPLPSRTTGKAHDGCARVIVYTPSDGKPKALGTQWRLSPKALDESAPLEERFRANLSRHAFAEPASDEHRAILESAACKYAAAVDSYATQFKDSRIDLSHVVPDPITDKLTAEPTLAYWFTHSHILSDLKYPERVVEYLTHIQLASRGQLSSMPWDMTDLSTNPQRKIISEALTKVIA
jgi:glutathione synthase/RimK-type ligase-like ATP-grasp enzyme